MTVRTDPFVESIDKRPDLKDPAQLLTEIDAYVEGLSVQSQAADSSGAMQGHPYPKWLYARAAEVLAATRSYVEASIATKPKPDEKKEPVKKAG